MLKKYLISGAAIILVLVGVGFLAWQQGFLGGDQALRRQIKNNPALLSLYDKAELKAQELAKHPDNAALYFDLGLYWKSIAEQGGPKEFFNKSLMVYEQGIEKFGQKNILFYLNAGKLAEHVDDFVKAESYYQKAIAISSGDESGYLDLAELYEYRFKKSKDEIVAVFQAGEKKLVNPTPILAAEASYRRRIGDNVAALEEYKVLSQAFPNNPGFKEIIQELEAKIKEAK
ncbi:MAG: hypothetical protein HY979_02960 [Candidatus Magasanikbacteria bacterium]|nr:hypothetical protein [Candidatus Magasanikbacteria bacterium]